jgi:hypothetical protein
MATFDIHFQIVPAAEQEASPGKLFTFGFTSAIGVKGPQKLINRWLKCLFTLKGTDLSDATYGTGYSELIGSNISSLRDFTDAVSLFVSDCNNQITAFDQAQFPPDDERLDSANISSIVPREDSGYDVYVTLKNTAGVPVTVEIPSGTTRT